MKTAIILGTFDGLHAGHRAVIEKAAGFFTVAVTFDIPPKSIITGEPQMLILPQEREKRLKELGVSKVEMQRFSDIRNIDAEAYLNQLKQKYNPNKIICGFNYHFGYKAQGDAKLLESFCNKNKIEFVCVPPVKNGNTIISATYLRNLIREGKIDEAAPQIYGGFNFTAPVLHGDARGRLLGFPTANQKYPKDLLKVKYGVYVSRVTIDKKEYMALTNIGVRPTYLSDHITCETFIKNFKGQIYEKQVTTELLSFVREEQRFSSADELKSAILNDLKILENI